MAKTEYMPIHAEIRASYYPEDSEKAYPTRRGIDLREDLVVELKDWEIVRVRYLGQKTPPSEEVCRAVEIHIRTAITNVLKNIGGKRGVKCPLIVHRESIPQDLIKFASIIK